MASTARTPESSSTRKATAAAALRASSPPPPAHAGVDPTFQYTDSYGKSEPFTKPHTVTILLALVGLVLYALYNQDEGSILGIQVHLPEGMGHAPPPSASFPTIHDIDPRTVYNLKL